MKQMHHLEFSSSSPWVTGRIKDTESGYISLYKGRSLEIPQKLQPLPNTSAFYRLLGMANAGGRAGINDYQDRSWSLFLAQRMPEDLSYLSHKIDGRQHTCHECKEWAKGTLRLCEVHDIPGGNSQSSCPRPRSHCQACPCQAAVKRESESYLPACDPCCRNPCTAKASHKCSAVAGAENGTQRGIVDCISKVCVSYAKDENLWTLCSCPGNAENIPLSLV